MIKQCTQCLKEKEYAEFSPDKRTPTGLQSRCKQCFSTNKRLAYAKNPEKYKQQSKDALLDPDYKSRKYRYNDDYRKKNPDKVKIYKQRERKNNSVRIANDNATRRKAIKDNTSEDCSIMYALRDYYRAMSLGWDFHVDHIIPVSRGGLHTLANLQVIPAIDNLRKGNK